MSRRDYFTNQRAQSGNKKSHALNHSRRVWNVNLQTVKVVLPNGQVKKVKVSAKTLKTLNKKRVCGARKASSVAKAPVAKTEVVVEAKEVKVPAKKPAAKKAKTTK